MKGYTFTAFKSTVVFNFLTDFNRLGVFMACSISLLTDVILAKHAITD